MRLKRLHLIYVVAALVAVAVAGVALARLSSQDKPSGRAAGSSPRGYVVLIHGGGWYVVGPGMTGFMKPTAQRLNQAGYGTINVDYRAGRKSLGSVIAAYDQLRKRVGPATKICAYGDSSGGNLALLLAQKRPDVACVIANAAPTDLNTLPRGHGSLRGTAVRLFGAKHLRYWSPAARTLKQPTLLAYGRSDTVVPIDQGHRMLRRATRATLMGLRKGPAPWIHVSVTLSDLHRLYAAQLALLRAATRR